MWQLNQPVIHNGTNRSKRLVDISDIHERYSHTEEVKVGSERSFGILFAVVLIIVALFPLVDGGAVRLWALVAGGTMIFLSFAVPAALKPLNRCWFAFGLLLHNFVNPVVMAFLFFFALTPVALVMRIMSKGSLPLEFDDSVDTYWIPRPPHDPAREDMRRQF